MERLTRLVDGEMEAATLEHNEAAELEELAVHLSFELNKVVKRQVELNMARDNDSPDKTTCCTECGGIMDTPERGGIYVCYPCQVIAADRKADEAADLLADEPTYPSDGYIP